MTITYDAIGNPLSYYNGTSYTFTWEGRRLIGAVSGSNTMSFEYNDEGIRTSKTVNGVETTYYVNGGQILAEKTDTRTIVYIYDASGTPIGMMYRTTSYAENIWDVFWYEKNLQGDIIAVYNSAGTKVATYTYSDAWGNHSVSYTNGGDSTGVIYNPFRYRSYYYDTDLGMYYLQSRYYDAKICRFISADGYLLTDHLLGMNLYIYCFNNPTTGYDPFGSWDINYFEEFGINCMKAAIAAFALAVAVLVIGGSITGTVMSGGVGAVAIPVAVLTASKALAISAAVIASIGVVSIAISNTDGSSSHFIGENGTQTPSETVWHGKGKERLDVENPSPGKRDGQVHYHDSQGKKHMFDFSTGKFTDPSKRLQDLMKDKGFLRGLDKAIQKYLGGWP